MATYAKARVLEIRSRMTNYYQEGESSLITYHETPVEVRSSVEMEIRADNEICLFQKLSEMNKKFYFDTSLSFVFKNNSIRKKYEEWKEEN